MDKIMTEDAFWYYLFTENLWKKESGEELRTYIAERYPFEETWLEKYIANDVYTLCINQGMNAELKICMKSKDVCEVNFLYRWNKWSEPESHFSLERYKQITKDMSQEKKLLYTLVLKVIPQQKAEVEKLVKDCLEKTPFKPEDYDFIAKQIAKCCAMSEEENRKVLKESIKMFGSIFMGIVMLVLFFVCNVLVSGYDVIGVEGLKRAFFESFGSVLIGIMVLGCLLHWLCKSRSKEKKPRKFIKVLAVIFCVLFSIMTVREAAKCIGACMDMKNCNQIEETDTLEASQTWEGLETVVLEAPKVYIKTENDIPTGYRLGADDTTMRFELGASENVKEIIEAHADETLTVYYYQHSHVIEKICSNDEILVGEEEVEK